MERIDELQIVAQTTAAMAAAGDLEATLQALLGGMVALTGAEAGGIRLLLDPRRHLGVCRLYCWRSPHTYAWVNAENLAGSDTVQALEQGRGVYSADLTGVATIGDFAVSRALGTPRPGSSLIVPLRAGNESIGTLHAATAATHAFDASQLMPLQVLADYAAGAVRQAQLHEEAAVRLRRLEVAQRVSTAVSGMADLDVLLTRVLEVITAHIGSHQGQIALVDADRRYVRGRVGVNLPPELLEATVRRLYPAPDPEEDIYAMVVRTDAQLTFGSEHPALHQPTLARFRHQGESGVLTPIRHGGDVIGLLAVVWERGPAADEADLALLRLVAEQIGGAITRARLMEAEGVARQQLAAALQASLTIVFTYGLDGRLTRVQGASRQLLGWDPDALVGRPILAFSQPSDHPNTIECMARWARGDRSVFQLEMSLLHSDGHPVRCLVTVGPHLQGDRVIGGAGAVTDHSTIKELQEERDAALAARARAEGAIRTGRSVVHELASPLGAVLGLAELLALDPRLPADMLQDLQVLQEQVTRVGHLLHRFGRLTRYEEMPAPGGPQLDLQRASGSQP